LAGSEKWNIHQQMQDQHISEMTNINLSLHTLGRCISGLAQQASGKDAHVPYRESKLTRLLQDSIGGNARTCLIATISPSRSNAEESISTLKFADRAKQVMVLAVVNETRPVDHALVQRLQKEIAHLKGMLRHMSEHMAAAGMRLPSGKTSSITADRDDDDDSVKHFRDDGEEAPSSSSSAQGSSSQFIVKREAALSNEKGRSKALGQENERLRKELSRYRSRVDLSSPGAQAVAGPDPTFRYVILIYSYGMTVRCE